MLKKINFKIEHITSYLTVFDKLVSLYNVWSFNLIKFYKDSICVVLIIVLIAQ